MSPPTRPPPSERETAFCTWCEGPDLHAHLFDRNGRALSPAPILTLFQADLVLTPSVITGRVTDLERKALLAFIKPRLPMGSPHDPRNSVYHLLDRAIARA